MKDHSRDSDTPSPSSSSPHRQTQAEVDVVDQTSSSRPPQSTPEFISKSPTSPSSTAATDSKKLALAATDMSTKLHEKWNTKNLLPRLGADFISASMAAGMVAPIISMVDRSIMENASGRRTLRASLLSSLKTLILRPHHAILSKPFALIFMLYGGTYLTANTLDTFTSTVTNKPPTHVTTGATKFFASSAANIGLCIYKDQVFVRMFGPPGIAPRAVALSTYSLFALRDCMTIFASFNVPPLLGPYVNSKLGEEFTKKWASGHSIAQFAAPAAVQFVSTPMHLLGLDIYNRPGRYGVAERFTAVARNWAVSSAARICRIVPAFGVGGVVNYKVRRGLMEKLE